MDWPLLMAVAVRAGFTVICHCGVVVSLHLKECILGCISIHFLTKDLFADGVK
jgi:hypothetical protein